LEGAQARKINAIVW